MIESLNFSKPTRDSISRMFQHFGFDSIFSVTDVMQVIGLTKSPTMELMRKLKESGLIKGVGNRGKYKFINSDDE